MSLYEAFLVVAELLQLVSMALIFRRNRQRNSVAGLSCDFVLYSWIASVTSAWSGTTSMLLLAIKEQYAARYPIYPELRVNCPIVIADFALAIVTTGILAQVFGYYRKTIRGDEWLSLPCKALMLVFVGSFSWFASLYSRGRSTINELDLVYFLWVIGAVSFAVRLISQVSNNYFMESFCPMHRHFLICQAASLAFVGGARCIAYTTNIAWHEKPTNMLTEYGLWTNLICLALLGIQSKIMTQSYLPISTSLGAS